MAPTVKDPSFLKSNITLENPEQTDEQDEAYTDQEEETWVGSGLRQTQFCDIWH